MVWLEQNLVGLPFIEAVGEAQIAVPIGDDRVHEGHVQDVFDQIQGKINGDWVYTFEDLSENSAETFQAFIRQKRDHPQIKVPKDNTASGPPHLNCALEFSSDF